MSLVGPPISVWVWRLTCSSCSNNRAQWTRSAFVSVIKSADSRLRDDFILVGQLDRADDHMLDREVAAFHKVLHGHTECVRRNLVGSASATCETKDNDYC
jgi:hypothetical protein